MEKFLKGKLGKVLAVLVSIIILILQQLNIIDLKPDTNPKPKPPTEETRKKDKPIPTPPKPSDRTNPPNQTTDPKNDPPVPPKGTKRGTSTTPPAKGKTTPARTTDNRSTPTKPTDNQQKPSPTKPTVDNRPAIVKELAEQRIVYTRHARCRMDCRHISKSEIQEILQKGTVNKRKSKPNDSPCPSYAVEGRTSDNQQVRIVFADCDETTKVITAIDLKKNYNCYCK